MGKDTRKVSIRFNKARNPILDGAHAVFHVDSADIDMEKVGHFLSVNEHILLSHTC